MDTHSPVIIVGYPRSGTTFFERVFHDVLSYSMSNEVIFISHLSSQYGQDRTFDTEDGYVNFLNGMLKDVFFRYYGIIYEEIIKTPITVDEILKRSPQRSIRAAVLAVLEIIAENIGAQSICAKNPGLGNHLPFLFSIMPEAKIIHVVRDGRDCSLSMRNLRWGDGNAYLTARRWQMMMDNVSQSLAQNDIDLLEVRYEDLLSNRDTWFSVLDFIQYGGEPERTVQAIESTYKGYTGNFNKWKTKLKASELYAFEAVAAKGLDRYGYEVVNPEANIGPLKRLYYTAGGIASQEIKKRNKSLKW